MVSYLEIIFSNFMNRFVFSMKALLSERKVLKNFLNNPALTKSSVLEITPEFLNENGIQVLVLDFDGVLAPHNGAVLLPEVMDWLKALEKSWLKPIIIFSNKPSPEREHYFKVHFPKIGFLKDVARKPYPEGLLKLQAVSHVHAEAILMVDDRLLTGILAAVLAGCRGLLICKPYQNFKAHPIKETFFQMLRFLDRLLV